MHLIERTEVDHPAAKAWPMIVSPEFFQLWNDKVISMEAKERFLLGQVFATRYRMSGRETLRLSEAASLEEGRLLEIVHSNFAGDRISPYLVVRERITLEETGGRTVIVKDVEIRNHGMHWSLVALFWLAFRFAKPAGPDKLKQLCDANT